MTTPNPSSRSVRRFVSALSPECREEYLKNNEPKDLTVLSQECQENIQQVSDDRSKNNPIIIGSIFGGILLIFLIAAGIFWYNKKKLRGRQLSKSETEVT